MNKLDDHQAFLLEDSRFWQAVDLFNQKDWYSSHDLFEEIWHELNGPERRTIQGILQVAVGNVDRDRAGGVFFVVEITATD